jgi:hypothetical protein
MHREDQQFASASHGSAQAVVAAAAALCTTSIACLVVTARTDPGTLPRCEE